MCEAKDFPPSERDELMGLVTQLQGQVAQLTAANEELHKQVAELKRAGKRQAAPFSKGGRSSRPKRPGRKPGMGSFSYRKSPSPDEVTEPLVRWRWLRTLAPDVEADSSMRECGLSTQPTFLRFPDPR